MAQIYGHAWVSGHGTYDVDDTWSLGLGGLSAQHIAEGIEECIKSGEDFPPSLPKFRRFCLGTPHPKFAWSAVQIADFEARKFCLDPRAPHESEEDFCRRINCQKTPKAILAMGRQK